MATLRFKNMKIMKMMLVNMKMRVVNMRKKRSGCLHRKRWNILNCNGGGGGGGGGG
ncbi:hypothetical protein Hdeb2414_s0025g00661501 [Helianthus debilis subsp. tardiflorus]